MPDFVIMYEKYDAVEVDVNPFGVGKWVLGEVLETSHSEVGKACYKVRLDDGSIVTGINSTVRRPTQDAADDGYWFCKCKHFNYPSYDFCQECGKARPRR